MNRLMKPTVFWISAMVFCLPALAVAQQASDTQPPVRGIDPLTALTVILIASFAIDRIVSGALTISSWLTGSKVSPEDASLARRQKTVYVLLAGVLGLVLGYWGRVWILAGLGFSTNAFLNTALTTLILMGGSERIAELMKRMGAKPVVEAEKPEPLVVEGKLVLVEEQAAKEEARKAAAAGSR